MCIRDSDNNVKVVFDVADPFAVSRNRDSFLKIINQEIDIIFANQSEIQILMESENLDFCIDNLMKIVNWGGIKLGKKGSLIFKNSEKHVIKPCPVHALDSTGAGDMYAAGFLTSLAKGKEYGNVGQIAVHLAEEVIKIQGAQFEKDSIMDLAKKIL